MLRILQPRLLSLPVVGSTNALIDISYGKAALLPHTHTHPHPHRNYHFYCYNNDSSRTRSVDVAPCRSSNSTTRTISIATSTGAKTRCPTITNLPLFRNITTTVRRNHHHNHHHHIPLNSTAARRSITTIKDNDSDSDSDSDKGRSQNRTIDTDQPSWNDEWKRIGLGAKIIPHLNDNDHHYDNDNDHHDNNDESNDTPQSQSPKTMMTNLLFVQTGFGVDQHGDRSKDGATKAAVRAVRNAIEFNSIPGVIEAVPGGRDNMLIQVLLGVPIDKQSYNTHTHTHSNNNNNNNSNHNVDHVRGSCAKDVSPNTIERPMTVDLSHVAKVLPYGQLLPIQIQVGGLAFPTGRIVHELGDQDDVAVCVAACISIGYDSGERDDDIHNTTRTDTAREGVSTHKTYDTRDGF